MDDITDNAHKLLVTLAQQDSNKRHQDTNTSDTLPTASNPDIVAWLRSLAPLSERDIYNQAWKD